MNLMNKKKILKIKKNFKIKKKIHLDFGYTLLDDKLIEKQKSKYAF